MKAHCINFNDLTFDVKHYHFTGEIVDATTQNFSI